MQVRYPAELVDRIKAKINEDAPLGPIDATEMSDPEVASILFDRDVEAVKTVLGRSFLIGRRGSGKSAILEAQTRRNPRYVQNNQRSITRPAFNYTVKLHAGLEFPKLMKSLSDAEKASDGALTVEWMSEKWLEIFWLYVADEIGTERDQLVRSSPEFMALEEIISLPGFRLSKFEEEVRQYIAGGQNELSGVARAFKAPSWETIRDGVVKFLAGTGRTAAIAFDSMDQYQIRDRSRQATLNGLIRAATRLNSMSKVVRAFFALPSEIYAQFLNVAANPLKDAPSVEFLHWSAKELLQICAFRFSLFLELHDRQTFETIEHIDLSTKQGVNDFWSNFFPAKVTNGLGLDEAPLAYIVRHTQLLPRQLLTIMNELLTNWHRKTGTWRGFSEDAIRAAVRDSEGLIAREVFSAFQAVYPDALKACRNTLSRLPIEVSYGEIQKQWRAHARPLMNQMGYFDFREFVEMLSELGIIGRASRTKLDSDRYIFVDFEYRERDHLILSDLHRICVHPLFYGLFQIQTQPFQKTVYPVGTDIDDEV